MKRTDVFTLARRTILRYLSLTSFRYYSMHVKGNLVETFFAAIAPLPYKFRNNRKLPIIFEFTFGRRKEVYLDSFKIFFPERI